MVALAIALLLGSAVALLLAMLRRRATRRVEVAHQLDAPARLLAWATGLVAADRAEWGEAMVGELEHVRQPARRWGFALSCLAAVPLVPPQRGGSGRLVVALVVAAAVGCAGLVTYGFVLYPAMLTERGTWQALAAFATVLAVFTLATLIIVRRGAVAGAGLAGGLAIGIVGGVTFPAQGQTGFSLLLLALPVAPLAVGAVTTWRFRSGAAGRQAALLSAIVAGLFVFLVVAAETLVAAGGPYDAGLIRDFPGSGLPDLATYSVSDNLGTAMSLLLLVSTMTAALGCAGATVAALIRRASAGAQ